ncbi:MAG: GWxTD domain-containing protein [Bacteroidota bacterium]
MTSISRRLVVVLLFTAVRLSFGQQDDSALPSEQNRLISFETITGFGEDTAQARVYLHYRIGKGFFVFVKSPQNITADDFVAKGELVVELLNEQSTSVAREIRPIRLTRTAQGPPPGPASDIMGAMEFSLKPGTYQVVFEVHDIESGRSFLQRHEKVTTVAPGSSALELSSPMLTQELSDSANVEPRFIPLNRGSNVFYGGSGGILLQLRGTGSQADMSAHWKLTGQVEQFGIEHQEFEGGQYRVFGGAPQRSSDSEEVVYTVKPSAAGLKLLYFPMPLKALEPGEFKWTLELSSGITKAKQELSFRVSWPTKPFSLRNWDLAVDALRHIATEEQMDEITSFSSSRAQQSFREFWKKKDPDTTTAFNEYLAEYYRRVDEAVRRYSTPNETDGYKTDRGRIFILFGSPTRTERLMKPNSVPAEIWTYENAKKRFVFTDPNKSGNYVLSQADNL